MEGLQSSKEQAWQGQGSGTLELEGDLRWLQGSTSSGLTNGHASSVVALNPVRWHIC